VLRKTKGTVHAIDTDTHFELYSPMYRNPDDALYATKHGLFSLAALAGPPLPLNPAEPSVPAIVHIVHEETGASDVDGVELGVAVAVRVCDGVTDTVPHCERPAAVGEMRKMRLFPWSATSADPFESKCTPKGWFKPVASVVRVPVARTNW
jgi:hypothetical protein